MEITTLIISLIILIIILAILIFFLLQSAKNKKLKEQQKAQVKNVKTVSLVSLRDSLKDKKLSEQELKNTLDFVLKDYGLIDSFDIYMDIIIRMTHHPRVNKDIIIGFDKELSRLNPKYEAEISRCVNDGLSSRRA